MSVEAFIKLAQCDLDKSPKSNWIEDAGGVPPYIKSIACALIRDHGFTIGHAIATAVNQCKKLMVSKNADPDTRAKASAAIAEWEKKKASSHVKATNSVGKVVEFAAPLFQSPVDKVTKSAK